MRCLGNKEANMKGMMKWVLALAFLPVLACENEQIVIDLAFESGEITGRDASRWVCGGGWFIATETDTFTVQQIPDEEIAMMLTQDQLGVERPIKVWVAIDHAPTSSCATNFSDHVKELSAIQLRED